MLPRSFAALSLLSCCLLPPSLAQAHDLERVTEFLSDANIVSGPELVDCTLSGGTKTTCFSITVRPNPTTYTPGPWCPQNIDDPASAGGIWFIDDEVRDVDGDLITRLAEIYDDPNWQLFDPETGAVRYTATLEGCEAAARPDVDPAYQNYCVQCLPEYAAGAELTYVIPLQPVMAQAPAGIERIGSGLAYNGIRLDAPAPVDAILGAYTIAPFDDCGGHGNPVVGYHYHAVTDCLNDAPATTFDTGEDAAQVGIAMDGFPILSHLLNDGSLPIGLDSCNGHVSSNGQYHYHAGAPGGNAILGCLVGEAGCLLREDGTCDASIRRPGPPPED